MTKQSVVPTYEPVIHKTVSIYDLIPHEANYNEHPQEQLDDLKASLRRFGQVEDVVVKALPDGKYKIAAHEGVTTAALQLLEAGECPYLEQWNITIVPGHWTDLDVKGYMAASNELTRKSNPDQEILAQLLEEQKNAGYPLESVGSDDEALRQMLESLGDSYLGSDESETEEDAAPEVEEEQTRVKLGDIWKLGRHKIACVNSCDAEQVKKLLDGKSVQFVFSDPPYGIEIVATNGYVGGGEAYDIPFGGVKKARGDVGGTAAHIRKTGMTYLEANQKGLRGSDGASKPFGSKNVRGSDGATNIVEVGKYFPVIGDDSTATAITAYRLCAELFPKAIQVWWGANYYANALPPSSCWIVWDKENTGNFADVELAWCSEKKAARLFRHMWNGMLKDSEHGQRRVHPTQKPIKLPEFVFSEFGHEDDVIYDPFLGSGISVIAAENLNRAVIGCELSPEYINVIITRWEKHTGQQAQLLERVEEPSHA